MGTDPVINAIKDDFAVAIESFEQDKFNFIVKIGNGIIDNLTMVRKKELMIYGIFLQEVGEEYLAIKKRNKDELENSKESGRNFIKHLTFTLDDNLDLANVWNEYYKFKKEISNYNKSEIELLVYKGDNIEFTEYCTSMLIEHLRDNKELLIEEDNGLLYGIINEQMRVITLYGFEHRDLLFYVLLIALIRYYILFYQTELEENKESNILKEKINPYVDKLLEIITEETKLNEKSNNLIGDMLYQSTIYIINYLGGPDLKDKEKKEDNRMKLLSKESREKIGKIIEEAIEKEIKK